MKSLDRRPNVATRLTEILWQEAEYYEGLGTYVRLELEDGEDEYQFVFGEHVYQTDVKSTGSRIYFVNEIAHEERPDWQYELSIDESQYVTLESHHEGERQLVTDILEVEVPYST